ncbi:hypothetical protein V6N11_050152 [Hibiscus sabdariffa]|uniref:Uncharacterized protein n=1 Tax=Hibiscus sabdariffa TaxID=183260 RepID=A0ABR2T8Z4_9ROSI
MPFSQPPSTAQKPPQKPSRLQQHFAHSVHPNGIPTMVLNAQHVDQQTDTPGGFGFIGQDSINWPKHPHEKYTIGQEGESMR